MWCVCSCARKAANFSAAEEDDMMLGGDMVVVVVVVGFVVVDARRVVVRLGRQLAPALLPPPRSRAMRECWSRTNAVRLQKETERGLEAQHCTGRMAHEVQHQYHKATADTRLDRLMLPRPLRRRCTTVEEDEEYGRSREEDGLLVLLLQVLLFLLRTIAKGNSHCCGVDTPRIESGQRQRER